MSDKRLENMIRLEMEKQPEPKRLEQTISACKKMVAAGGREKRTGFWEFLSDVFRFDGPAIMGTQFVAFLAAAFGIGTATELAKSIPVYMPLFILAAIPVLLKGSIHGMDEMEAVTRASNAQIILAKIILTSAATLICLTFTWCMEIYLLQSTKELLQLILYSIVPILACAGMLLWIIRTGKHKRVSLCTVLSLSSCAVWGMLAHCMPGLYETSATGVWLIAFVTFSVFFGRELIWLANSRKEGKLYGIIP